MLSISISIFKNNKKLNSSSSIRVLTSKQKIATLSLAQNCFITEWGRENLSNILINVNEMFPASALEQQMISKLRNILLI